MAARWLTARKAAGLALVLGASSSACNQAAQWCVALGGLRDKEANCPQTLDAGAPYLSDAGFLFVGCESILADGLCSVPERETLATAGSCLQALPACQTGQDAEYNAKIAACLAGNGGEAGDAGSPVPALNTPCAVSLYGVGAL